MNNFDERNKRVRRAKQKRLLNNFGVKFVLWALLVGLVLVGVALLILGRAFGWMLIGFVAWPAMMIFWIQNALSEIEPGPTEEITDLLAEELLLALSSETMPRDLAGILSKTRSGTFMMARFSLTLPLFEQIAEFLPKTMDQVFGLARGIMADTNSEEVTGAIMVVALVRSIANYQQLLSQLQLSEGDLVQGVIWFNYLNGIVKDARKPIHSGGIARDFAFGFTPTLQKYAIDLSAKFRGSHTKLQQKDHVQILQQMIEIFTHGGRQNVALVGSLGCGRSTLVSAFAEMLMNADSAVPNSLKYRQIFSLDVASLITAAKNAGDLEYLTVSILNEVFSADNIILCLDNAQLFFGEGAGSVDLTNLLVPVLEAGTIRMILIMDEQGYLEIAARNAALSNALNKIVVEPSNEEETMRVLMDQAPILEYQKNVVYTYRALKEAYRLGEQYIHDVEMPGKAKLLLETAANYSDNGLVTAESVATAIEKSFGVKVRVAQESEERGRLLNLENLIHERMVDQIEAVSAVANALRRAAAGVKNSGRPIGTFLFLGPTGVGKTELAKSLADVYFGGEGNMIRLDMNEFVTEHDVMRLIRDGAEDALSLTAQVAKHPFSVILLDEIEKAHPAVLTTLLQVLDEGILRDEKNREVSFRDSIMIATSNAGANEIRERIMAGEQIAGFEDELIDKLITSGEFRPEFLNRFDEICLFKPLSKTDLVAILDLIIASTNKTLEPQKISVVVDPEAKQVLIDQGYDPKMGARPMRRIVQKTVENIVAAAILSGHATPGSTLTITSDAIQIR